MGFTDEDLQQVKRIYVNASKPGDRLILRMIARIEASDELAQAVRDSLNGKTKNERDWKVMQLVDAYEKLRVLE